MRTHSRGWAIAAAWALLLAPPLAILLKLSVYAGWMLFVVFLGAIPLALGYALQIVIASNGMFRTRGVFNTQPDAGRGILAAWLTSLGILLASFSLVDGGDDGTYGSALTELMGASSTDYGSNISMLVFIPSALLWIVGWIWLVTEWIILLTRARRSAAG